MGSVKNRYFRPCNTGNQISNCILSCLQIDFSDVTIYRCDPPSSPSPTPLRIDSGGVIKVADFGLSEDVYSKNYFRQGTEDAEVRLPIRWMALESLQDSIFSEKTDVVRRQIGRLFVS